MRVYVIMLPFKKLDATMPPLLLGVPFAKGKAKGTSSLDQGSCCPVLAREITPHHGSCPPPG